MSVKLSINGQETGLVTREEKIGAGDPGRYLLPAIPSPARKRTVLVLLSHLPALTEHPVVRN